METETQEQEKETTQPAAQQPIPQQQPPAERTTTAVEQAKALADRIDAANAKTEELLQRQEALHAEQLLGGKASAGQVPEPAKEETPKEYKDRIMRGDLKDGEGRE